MLKNMWYACEFSHDVTNKPKAATVLGQKLVLWRDSKGNVRTLSDLCVHRGGPLSLGWLTSDGDNIACPYHGWEFKGDGACQKIPAQPQRNIPKKARVDSYPTAEKYGFVFAFMGDLPEAERPPLPTIPELEDTTYARVYGEYNWNVNYERAMERAMEPSHASPAQSGGSGNGDNLESADHNVRITEWSGLATAKLAPAVNNSKGLWERLTGGKSAAASHAATEVTSGYYLPNINILHVPSPKGNLILVDASIPVGPHDTRSLFIGLRDFSQGSSGDKDALKRIRAVFEQDDAVITAQRPELLPFDLAGEMHVNSDALSVAYRRRRDELLEAGWGIDMHEIAGDGPRETAIVIPSPARRDVPELARAWTHKEASSYRPSNGGNDSVDLQTTTMALPGELEQKEASA